MPQGAGQALKTEPDYYAVLGVDYNADEAELRRAYRVLILRLHPDRCSGDPSATERFWAVQEAYDTLRDPESRAKHNQRLTCRLDLKSYLDCFADLMLTAQGLGLPVPKLSQPTKLLQHLDRMEAAAREEGSVP